MTSHEAAESLEHIRGVLERTTRYRLISWRGILGAGAFALAAAVMGHQQGIQPRHQPAAFLLLWGAVFACSLALGWWTTAQKARKAGEQIWSRKLQAAGACLLPALMVGLLLTALLADIGRLDLAPGIWMALYGVGVLAASHWLDWEFQLTAWAFLASAAVALFLLRGSPHLSMAAAFGGIHALLGVYRWRKEPA